MKKWQRVILWVAGGVVLLAALVAVTAPGIIRSQAIKQVEKATGRNLTIRKVVVNPFTLTAGADGVVLTEKGSAAPFVSFSSARVSISPRSLFKGIPIVSGVTLVSPSVSIVRSGDNAYNFSDLLEKKEPGPPEKKETTDVCINNISISRGTVIFRDRALAAEKTHTISDLRLSLPFISTIPYLADHYITPRLSAVVNGAPLQLEGKIKKLPSSAEMAMSLNLKELSLPWYMPYLPASMPIAVPSGTLSTSADITYRVSAKSAPQLMVRGSASLAELSVKEKGGNPLASLKRGAVAINEADIFAQRYDVQSVNLDGLEVNLGRDRQGRWNVARLGSDAPPPAATKAEAKKGKAPVIRVAAAALRNSRLLFTDNRPAKPFSTELEQIAIDLARYSSDGEAPADFSISFASGRGETVNLKGTQTSVPLTVKGSLSIGDVALATYYPYLEEWLTAPVKGTVGVKGEVAFSPATGFVVDKADIEATSLAASFAGDEGVKISRLALDGGSLDLKKRRLGLERIALRGSTLTFSRDRQGNLSPLKLIRERRGGQPAAPPVSPGTTKEEPFTWNIGAITGDEMKFSFRDGTIGDDPPEFLLRKASLSLKNVESTGKRPVPFRLKASYGDEGALAASGDLVLQPTALRGSVRLQKIPLTDFDVYFPENLNITLADGSVDVAGRVDLAKRSAGWSGTFGGDLGVRSFYCLDAEDDDLLKWESLQLEDVSGTLGPFALSIKDVVLNHYFAKIIIEKDGTLNLQHLMEPTETGGADQSAETPEASPPPERQPATATASSARPIKIGAVVLQDGLLNFTDNHLNPTYSTTFYNLGGRVSGLSSETNRFADVDLRGNLENQSPLRITGQINPLRDDLFVNLTMRFTDIEMSPLSPYSSTYLGYLIDKGKLFLDLKYHIEQKKLESTNTVFLDQLTLGEKVDSPKATSLPVRLAIALLKDRKGEIHLDLPVSGRTDDPKFSVWGVVLQMLKNIAVKAATAPFALLQSVFGGSEDFGGVNFPPGTAKLSPGEGEKLTKLATALKDRPALKIEMTGYVDREADPEGLRRELLEKKIRTEKFLELVKERKNRPGDSPETMQVAAEEYPKYLTQVYRKEKFPKPRTIIGLIKDIPEQEMKKLIYANTVIGTKDLQVLAVERTASVRDFLVERGGLDAGRIFLKTGDIFKEPDNKGEARSRVEFGMAAQ